ncbi:MAG: hypothetical protein ACOYNY_15595 [Caldilineaceae bacterium]
MESLLSMEFLFNPDSIICMISGVVAGVVMAQFLKGWSISLVGNIVAGLVGGLFGGAVFNSLDFMDLSDYADPIVAGIVGAVVVITVGGVLWRAIRG